MPAIFRTVLVTALVATCARAPAVHMRPAMVAAGASPHAAVATTAPLQVVAVPAHLAADSGGSRSGMPGVPVPVSEFGWPILPVPEVSRPFQPPSRPYGPGHRGADLVGTEGQPVLAAGPGVVVYAGPLADRGVVSVDHVGGLRTTYEPLVAGVRPGQVVGKGQVIGTLAAGHAGCPAPACLHWGLRRGREYLDPLLLVRPAHVRLLPVAPET